MGVPFIRLLIFKYFWMNQKKAPVLQTKYSGFLVENSGIELLGLLHAMQALSQLS